MKQILTISALVLLALALRLYRIDTPLADWHSWRQVDTAAVTRRYVNEGIDLLHPKYDDLSSIPSGKENPQGYRMVEFPFVNGFIAYIYQQIPITQKLPIHVFSRIIAALFSLGSLIYLYLLVEKLSGSRLAFLSSLVFALLPYNLFYSRTVLPEVPLVFFSLASMYYFISEKIIVSSFLAALALLLKPYALVLALPLFYYQYNKYGLKIFKDYKVYLYLIIALTPLILWRYWIQQFPEGIPAYKWLLNGNGIRFKGAWFRWLFADRLGRMILGYWGLIPLSLGVLSKFTKKEGLFYYLWALAILVYLTVFATGNVQHDYYQIITIPIISIFVARGLLFLLKPPKSISHFASYSLILVVSLFTLAFSWFHIRDLYNINHPEIVEAGQAADKILPPDAKVIAPYQGDTAFLYQTNRQGWPIGGSIENKVKLGATDYVTTTFDDEANLLLAECKPSVKTKNYAIINLQNCNKLDL